MADVDDLKATRSNLITALKVFSADLALGKHKPSYTIDGQTVNWTRYQEILTQQIKDLTALIEKEDDPFFSEMDQAFVDPPYGV